MPCKAVAILYMTLLVLIYVAYCLFTMWLCYLSFSCIGFMDVFFSIICLVEQAIDHLLAISDDKSQSNQSMDDDRNENSFRRTSEGVIGSRDHYSHPHGHAGNGSGYSLWQESDHYKGGYQQTVQPSFDYSSNSGSHGNYPNPYTYATVPRTESYHGYTTTHPYSVDQHQHTTSRDHEEQYQLFGGSDYHDKHRSVVPRSSNPSFWNQHQGLSFSRPSAPPNERDTVGSVREHPQPSQVASQSTRPRPMGSDSKFMVVTVCLSDCWTFKI